MLDLTALFPKWKEHIDKHLEKKYFEKIYKTYQIYGAEKEDVRKIYDMDVNSQKSLKDVIKTYGWANLLSNDSKVRLISKYVNDRLRYSTDHKNYGRWEWWANPFAVHQKRVDDCDGFATLITWFCWQSGVPKQRLKLAVGWIYDTSKRVLPTGKGLHAYVLYLRELDNEFYPLEGSYQSKKCWEYYKSKIPFRDNPLYGKIEWLTDDDDSWRMKK